MRPVNNFFYRKRNSWKFYYCQHITTYQCYSHWFEVNVKRMRKNIPKIWFWLRQRFSGLCIVTTYLLQLHVNMVYGHARCLLLDRNNSPRVILYRLESDMSVLAPNCDVLWKHKLTNFKVFKRFVSGTKNRAQKNMITQW